LDSRTTCRDQSLASATLRSRKSRNTSGRNQVTSGGAFTDYSKVLSGVRALLDDNVSLEVATAVAIMSPGVWQRFEGLATGIASDKTQLARPRALENTRFLVTTNGLDTGSPLTSTIFMGDSLLPAALWRFSAP
jgi:hypothetical protein